MSFRRRLSTLSAVAVAIAVAGASGITYIVVGHQLHEQIDSSLESLAEGTTVSAEPARGAELRPTVRTEPARTLRGKRLDMATVKLPARRPSNGAFAQLVASQGKIVGRSDLEEMAIPVDAKARSVAEGKVASYFDDVEVDGSSLRVFTTQLRPNEAVQVARPLDEVDSTMDRLAIILALITLAGIAAAALMGRLVARRAVEPVARLTDAAEHVATTHDLSARIHAEHNNDELDRLAASFNRMLGELETAEGAQRQLVADASHELRTPLTSLRTNIEVLSKPTSLPDEDRERLLRDVLLQLDELGGLVGSLVDLARNERELEMHEDLRFDELVSEAVERAGRGGAQFALDVVPCLVSGAPDRLDRAVSNLLDNAAKWSPAGEPIEVSLSEAGVLTVRDHGPGIEPQDLSRVFDRFYRAPGARGMMGSGLGLAIAQQVAEAHGGSTSAANADGGGALLTFAVPALDNFSANSSLALS